MTNRYCAVCRSTVADVAGLCPLGHALEPLEDPMRKVSSIRELRREVDLAFERARHEVAAVMGTPHQSRARAVPAAPPPPPPPIRRPAPPAPPILPAPPRETVWTALEHPMADSNAMRDGDPISAFAPAPRMDWGPKRSALLEWRGPFRRPSSASV
jgi:hypothetical protein